MELIFVHGWSVRNTDTYGELPTRLEQELTRSGQSVRVDHIYLGKYVSFNDEVNMDDLSLAFERAVRDKGLTNFACITHSTGGPLVRTWITQYGGRGLSHLIMLAPANHGSALAQLGKSRLGRVKAFFESVEPGQKVLDWLELGSEEQWRLNLDWLDFNGVQQGIFPFTLIGQSIDRKFYDHLNSYTGEPGSDGVVRVAAANLNYNFVRLAQQPDGKLALIALRRTAASAFAVLPGLSHGGSDMGIMQSVGLDNAHPAVDAILECLEIRNEGNYKFLCEKYRADTQLVQASERIDRWRVLGRDFVNRNPPHSMAVFRVVDEQGRLIEDYDLFFTAGDEASPELLPQGVFQDRQHNSTHQGRLTYYLDHDKLDAVPIGFEIVARPQAGLVRFETARIAPQALGEILQPNETILIEIVLRRIVDPNCFQLTERRASGEICGAAA